MAVRVAINGFGRIGRCIVRSALKDTRGQGLEFVAVNDLTDPATLAHLFRYDSVHGRFPGRAEPRGGGLTIDGQEIQVLSEKDPAKLPWKDLKIDIVLEATGRFRDRESVEKHLAAGAAKVIVTAPAKGEDVTICLGVNEEAYDPAKHRFISNASCTTNCLTPLVKVLLESFGFRRGYMTTIHSYTNDQQLLDLPHKDWRRARAAAVSIIPTTTGAASATGLVLPQVKGKIDGTSLRVPTPDVSVVALAADVGKAASVEAVNDAFRKAAAGRMKGVLEVSDEELVSVDYIGHPASAILDAASTAVVDGSLVNVLAWYDNEWGYASRCVDLTRYVGERLS
ncbi:MAG: type I glyceraldehyde-3-phosphate dehydrogenase [Gemmatimonadota bacterium]